MVMQDVNHQLFTNSVESEVLISMEKVGELLKDLAESGKTVLVSTHDPELIDKCCDYVLCIDRGKIIADE